MSRFLTQGLSALEPYTPGEQPRDRRYIKLNTNESPFPPPQAVIDAAAREAGQLQLYSDPASTELTERLAKTYGVRPGQVIVTNGSDEVLSFAFQAFADAAHPLAFADITYGFYPVFAALYRIPWRTVPLKEDFSIDPDDYIGTRETVVIANPNAPTGLCLPLGEIERIVASNPDRVVIVDEAYVDFGGESAVGLLPRYENLLVTRTFSKSRSLAGARLGFGMGSEALIADLHTVRCSTNPYNVNRMTAAAGVAALENDAYFIRNCRVIEQNRDALTQGLRGLGFAVPDSRANFVFARSRRIGGRELYLELKRRGILVRHFEAPRTRDYNRITVGTAEQVATLLQTVKQILEEQV